MNKPLVSIILPVYNGKKFIVDTLSSLINQDYDNFEIIVIDDCSTDDSFKFIKDNFNNFFEGNIKIRVIKNIGNMGCIKTCNKAIRLSKGEYIFRTDQDTSYNSDVIIQLMRTIKNKKVGAVGCKLLYPNSNIIRAFGINIDGLLRSKVIGRDEFDEGQYNKIMEVDSLPGGAMLFKKSLGGFNEDYKLYYSEPDFCLNIKKKGFRVLVNPKAIAVKYGTKEKIGIKKSYFILRDKVVFMKNQLIRKKEAKKDKIKEWEGYITQ